MALTQATELADFTSGIGTAGAILEVDNNNNRIGIGTTNPQALLQVGQIIKMDGPSGIVTATTFSGNFTGNIAGNATGLTGAPDITVNNIIGVGATFSGEVTYEDVTNIDSVGVVTARSGIHVNDSITHIGDTNTKIRFPSPDTFTVETAGTERLRVNSDGVVAISTGFTVGGDLNVTGISTFQNNVHLLDDDELRIGNSNDLRIYHSTFNRIISTGVLTINSDDDINLDIGTDTGDTVNIRGGTGSNETLATFAVNGSVDLYYDNAMRFNTSTYGVSIYGSVSEYDYLQAPFNTIPNASMVAITVTVATKTASHRYNGTGSGNAYVLNGVQSPFLTLTPGRTYRFNLSSSDMTSHPFRFYLEADKTTAYTTNVTSTSTYTEIVVTDSTPQVLHYQCSSHGYMGNAVQTNSNIGGGFVVADESSDTTCFPLFATAATGTALAAKSGTNLTFNSSSGALTATSFVGALTGNADTATTLATARNIGGVSFDGSAAINLPGVNAAGNQDTSGTAAIATNVTVADESSDTTCFPLFATAATGNLPPKSGTNLTFNSSSGALTATSFVGSVTGNVTGNTSGTAGGLTGTPNIDCGTGSFTGNVDIADKIIHTGDTNTAIRFPAADTFTVETAGSERLRVHSNGFLELNGDTNTTGIQFKANGTNIGYVAPAGVIGGSDSDLGFRVESGNNHVFYVSAAEKLRIDSSGRLLLGTATEGETTADDLTIATSGSTGITIRSGTSAQGNIFFSDGTSGDAEYRGMLRYEHNNDAMVIKTAATERLRIDSNGNFIFKNAAMVENGNVSSSAATGTQNFDLVNGMVLYRTSNSTGTWKPNFRINGSVSLNSVMADDDVVSPTLIVAKGATSHYATTIQIDGSDVTPEFLGGAPSDGGGSGTFDSYSYTIIKTGNAAFKVFASVNTYE